jgi:hypothetical protein
VFVELISVSEMYPQKRHCGTIKNSLLTRKEEMAKIKIYHRGV